MDQLLVLYDSSNVELELYSCLSFNIDAFSTFHHDNLEFLHRKEGEVCKRYGIALHLCVVPGLQEVDHHELKGLLEAFIELREDLTKRQWYDRVNQVAIHRIYGKLEKHSKSVDPCHHDHKSKWLQLEPACDTQCLSDLERLNDLVAEISRACFHTQPDPTCRSLYLRNICDQQSPSLVYPNAVYRTIRDDQASTLAKLLEQQSQENVAPDSHLQAFLHGLLRFSITSQSGSCARHLLFKELPNNGFVIDQDCINHLITIIGQSNMPADCDNPKTHGYGLTHQIHETEFDLFLEMLAQLRQISKQALQADDALGRLPLHYSALYGLTSICQLILDSLQGFGDGSFAAEEAILSVDYEGCTSLHYAVIHNHTAVTRLLLDILEINYKTGDKVKNQKVSCLLGNVLHVALQYQYNEVVHLLVSSRVDIDHRSSHGETALYIAARIGRADYMKVLLKPASDQTASVDACETVYGWTPLFVACAEGNLAVVQLLLQAGASQTILDYRGWTAKEHAAYRGHLAVAEMLQMCRKGDLTGGPASMPFKAAVGADIHLRTDHSHIIANLGVVQKGNEVTAVDLNCCSSNVAQSLHTETRFSIEVSTPGGCGSSRLVQLPILDDMINEPFIFPIERPGEAQLVFDIFRTTPAHGKKGILVGSGTALLASHNHCFGAKRESLVREHTVPILGIQTSKYMGTVTFTFVIAKPLDTPLSVVHFVKELKPLQLIGHRGEFQPPPSSVSYFDPVEGLGQNIAGREHLQLGENTVKVNTALCCQIQWD